MRRSQISYKIVETNIGTNYYAYEVHAGWIGTNAVYWSARAGPGSGVRTDRSRSGAGRLHCYVTRTF